MSRNIIRSFASVRFLSQFVLASTKYYSSLYYLFFCVPSSLMHLAGCSSFRDYICSIAFLPSEVFEPFAIFTESLKLQYIWRRLCIDDSDVLAVHAGELPHDTSYFDAWKVRRVKGPLVWYTNYEKSLPFCKWKVEAGIFPATLKATTPLTQR